MTFIIADRVKETSTTTGTGAMTLAGAMTGFQAFSAACAVDDTCYYALQAVDAGGQPTGDWECGLGTYSAANTLTRTTVTSSSNAGSAVSLAAGTKQVFISVPAVQAAWPRERLTADRTYYVRTDGSDSNTGLVDSAGGAFLTIQKAVNTVLYGLVVGGYQITVQLADGTYNEDVVIGPLTGSTALIIQGNATTPSNVVIHGSVAAVKVQLSGWLYLKNVKLTCSDYWCLLANSNAVVDYSGIVFGACAGIHVNITTGAICNILGSCTIDGNALYHWYMQTGGSLRSISMTTTLSGTRAFTTFAVCNSVAVLVTRTLTFTGTATGKKYDSVLNSIIDSATGGASYPGNVEGTTATGGQYA